MMQEKIQREEALWWVLQKLKRRSEETHSGTFDIYLELENIPLLEVPDQQAVFLQKLADEKAISYIHVPQTGAVALIGTEEFEITLIEPKFSEIYKQYENIFNKREKAKLATADKPAPVSPETPDIASTRDGLKSLHLVSNSLEPTAIFLVLDRRFESPIRCDVRNAKGRPTYMKKLYDIAYFVDAPGKRVSYSKNLADNINNGIFKIAGVAQYMKTNGFKKPTLVQKSAESTLVLKNEVLVKTELVKNIPSQFQSLYIDKTR